MDAVAPLSVMLMGLLGVVVVLTAVLRIVVVERRLHAATVRPVPLVPPAPRAGTSLAA